MYFNPPPPPLSVPAVSLGQGNLSREQSHQFFLQATSSALLGLPLPDQICRALQLRKKGQHNFIRQF